MLIYGKASQYLEYVTTGNRVHFETTDTHRRVQLVSLVIGELLTGNGTYMDQICNGLWLVLEESTWETPGHLHIQKAGKHLSTVQFFHRQNSKICYQK